MLDSPSSAFLAVRDALAARYTLEREIGHGGMADVYLARDRVHDRPVALKVLRSELEGVDGEARFLREIKLLANLQHPNIVSLHDSGILELEGGARLPFFTMPYITGESLRERMRSRQPLPPAEAIRILREIADALAGAHAAGTVHRDLKPENVLLSQGHAMVSDFGIAKARSREKESSYVTVTGLILGTPAYMAPEQGLDTREADGRADLYSLGAIAYELLTGAPPFGDRTPQQLLVAHVTEAPAPILQRATGLDPDLAALVMRLLEKRPEDRPRDAAEVVAALDAIATTRRPRRPAASAQSVRTVIATFVFIAAAGAFIGWRLTHARAVHGPSAVAATLDGSVAVLPFDNLSGDPQKQYFSDGMTEQIMYTLGRVPGIRVSPRTSAFAFRGRNAATREIGTQLHVGHVLEGSVREVGTRLRVNARLVDAASGDAIWSEEYERSSSDVFQVQDDIATAIAGALSVRLATSAATTLARPATQNVEAYDLYLQGRYFYERRTTPDLLRAISLFDQAIRVDHAYARAYAGLSSAYALLALFGDRRPDEVVPLAEAAATTAISLDSTSAEAFTSRGIVRLLLEWQWAGAETALERAIALDPRSVPARLFHAWSYVVANRLSDAEREMRLGVEMDPLSKIMNTRLGTMLQYQRRDSEAVIAYGKTLALDSTDGIANGESAESWIRLRRCDEALRAIRRISDGPASLSSAPVGFVLASCGREAEARALVSKFERQGARSQVSPMAMAGAYAALGTNDGAIRWLERAYAEHDGSLFQVRLDPMFASLGSDPRFMAIVDRLRFP